MDEIDKLRLACELYREAIEDARNCCGCGEGHEKECAADILAGHGDEWGGGVDPVGRLARTERDHRGT